MWGEGKREREGERDEGKKVVLLCVRTYCFGSTFLQASECSE